MRWCKAGVIVSPAGDAEVYVRWSSEWRSGLNAVKE